MTPEQQAELEAQLVSLAISFLVQAWPLVLAYERIVVQMLIDMIPGTPAQELVRSAHNVIAGIWKAHPDWPEDRRRRFAVDAIELRAKELGADILPDQLRTWGLA